MNINIQYEHGVGIKGKILTFECQQFKPDRKRKKVSSRHRGVTGKLYNATCV
ncbi:unnamed protein product, partial [marine sediment metagenome]